MSDKSARPGGGFDLDAIPDLDGGRPGKPIAVTRAPNDSKEANAPTAFGLAFDLDDIPKKAPPPPPSNGRPGGPPQSGGPRPNPSQPGAGVPPGGSAFDAELDEIQNLNAPPKSKQFNFQPPGEADLPGEPAKPLITKEHLDEVARVAKNLSREAAEKGRVVAEKTRIVAEKTRDVAVHAAIRSVGGGGQAKSIRLEDPSTWLKPMLGPIILFGLGMLISIVAVVASKITGDKVSVTWLTVPLLLAAVVFGVVRWIKLQKED